MKNIPLGGMISTVVTPFRDDDTIDLDLLRAEVRYLLGAGVTAICACGSTGEGQTLSLEESRAICEVVVDEVAGTVPVIGGVIQNSTAQAIRYSLALKEVGVDALQVTPVHYVFAPSAEETVEHYRLVGEAADLPIILYNVVPWALVGLETIKMIADVPQVVAIKQSGGNMHLLVDLLADVSDRFVILAALDNLHYPAFVLGAHGALAAIPTVTPHLSVELWDATQKGDHELARELHRRVLTVWRAIDGPNLPALLKEALRLQGRNGGLPRKPFAPATPDDSARIEKALRAANLID
ncbi:dihydrodipicolinate synthase family protein [Mycolicibacterium sp. 018/SC-01/001]|uniref:dihydrodipicolinate synthase family protein n=1 Tax=Mycolicibacterium sp. 018/SC-01/001 TaxID=2592069 RepID=UPI0011804E5B|nr:dihydrodipicolinate synthase family protein [Mycolicibacterium sp. 018/SC-01/001]TRW88871.1 dihydrodipicolinate synthase family protein [Mycolicibacterium sp. 018/SC-01/001]